MTILLIVLATIFFAGAALGLVAWALCRAADMGDDMGERQRRER